MHRQFQILITSVNQGFGVTPLYIKWHLIKWHFLNKTLYFMYNDLISGIFLYNTRLLNSPPRPGINFLQLFTQENHFA